MRLKAIIAAALAVSGSALAAQAGYTAHRRHSHQVAAALPQAQIACTVLGCMAIPAACTPVAGKTRGGRPTGFDVIVCPPGVWPFK